MFITIFFKTTIIDIAYIDNVETIKSIIQYVTVIHNKIIDYSWSHPYSSLPS